MGSGRGFDLIPRPVRLQRNNSVFFPFLSLFCFTSSSSYKFAIGERERMKKEN